MARRKPQWVVLTGGPLDGERGLLGPGEEKSVIRFTPATPGMQTPHEYRLTEEIRKGGFHEASSKVAQFVRSLAPQPVPPVPCGHTTPG